MWYPRHDGEVFTTEWFREAIELARRGTPIFFRTEVVMSQGMRVDSRTLHKMLQHGEKTCDGFELVDAGRRTYNRSDDSWSGLVVIKHVESGTCYGARWQVEGRDKPYNICAGDYVNYDEDPALAGPGDCCLDDSGPIDIYPVKRVEKTVKRGKWVDA